MLRIRLSRTGRTKQESFRVIIAEHARPVKGKFIEVLGHYQPSKSPKTLTVKKDRIEYWISKGAQPSSTVAGLLKKNGFNNMEKYIAVRPANIKKKSEQAKKAPAAEKKEAAPAAK